MTKLMEKMKRSGKSSAEPTNEATSLAPAARSSEQYQRWRRTGVTIQIVLFISNGGVWVISILAIVGGFIVGLNTKTINIRLELLDLTVTTPATIFITYGLIIVLASILGCFTATGGNVWITIGFICAGIIVLIFDATVGIRAFFSTKSFLNYMQSMKSSMDDYGRDKGSVGIFRIRPTTHWDHLQARGQCCGMEYYDDWKNTSLGRESRSVPDTCCNAEYEYQTCGSYIFHHPDTEHHEASDIIHTRGCIRIFPAPLVASFESTVYIGIFLGAVIIFCILLAAALLALVLTHRYIPGGGPERWRYARKHRAGAEEMHEEEAHAGDPSQWNRGTRRVGPAGGDQRRGSQDNENNSRRVSFKGPSQFIPSKNLDAAETERRKNENRIFYNEEKRRNSD